MRKRDFISIAFSIALTGGCTAPVTTEMYTPSVISELRAPAVPLITIDPYTSAWSFADKLHDETVRHWTAKDFPLLGSIRVDGESFRFMGRDRMDVKPVIAPASSEVWEGMYTEKMPQGDWRSADYNPQGWKSGKAGFGTDDNPNISTPWLTDDIWVRRTFDWPETESKEDLVLQYSHDDNIEVYLNGVEIAVAGNGLEYGVLKEIPENVMKALKPTGNVLAAHCKNNGGGAYVDLGIMRQIKRNDTFDRKAEQKSVNVLPTQTYYTFECAGVALDIIFTAPLLMDDLYTMSSPFNYLTYQVRSVDNKEHDVQIYLEATPQWAVNEIEQPVSFEKINRDGMTFLKTGTVEQNVLGRKGDGICIDWGYFYLAAQESPRISVSMDEYHSAKTEFMSAGKLSGKENTSPDMTKQMTVLAISDDLGKVSANHKSGFIMIGYDDIYSIQYFEDNRMAYWKNNGETDICQAFLKGAKGYADIMQRCKKADAEIMHAATSTGGKKYAELCALAYRQAISAHKLVTDQSGNILFLSKENYSNGSIGTVDITYPSSPLFMLYNPELLKGMMNPIFYYSESGKWTKPFAAHDVGTYPLANGQTYEGDMPVEESGNMLILTTAIAMLEGNADYAAAHWDVLTTWTDYLLKEGLDPANQLCTDDFAGHFAHNTNLSIKAIMGIAGYSKLAGMLGKKDIENKYRNAAQDMGNQWAKMADDGDHYRLTFDQPGTWSQKYNLIWDRLLGFNLFPTEVASKEMAFYLTKQNKYGLPLDNRMDYTKSDWIIWTGCLTESPQDFNALMQPVWLYANETTSRVPLSDWHFTSTASQRGFQARSVVGGYYMKLLQDKFKEYNIANEKAN